MVEHRSMLRKGVHSSPYLQHSWNQYGEEAFVFRVLEQVPETEHLLQIEQQWLDDVKPFPWENPKGYNISPDAIGGYTWGPKHPRYNEIVEKMKKINSGENNGMWGKEHTEETLQLMKDRAEGRYTLEWFIERYGEEKGKQRYKSRCKRLSNREYDNPMNHEKHRKKISETLQGRNVTWKDKISKGRKGKGTGKANVNYKEISKTELKQKVKEELKSKELAEYFDVSQNTITRKLKKHFGCGLREARKQFRQ
jgi:group I intron endonuclease